MGEVRTDVRVQAEGLGIIVKTITTYFMLLHDSKSQHSGELALMAFALGQLAYSAAVFGVYKLQFPQSSLWPTGLPNPQRTPKSVTCFPSFLYLPTLKLNRTARICGLVWSSSSLTLMHCTFR